MTHAPLVDTNYAPLWDEISLVEVVLEDGVGDAWP